MAAILSAILTCVQLPASVHVSVGWRGVPGGNRIRGEQGSDLEPAEAAAPRHGPV